ncbi:MAG TPA: hypothetical protein VJ810_08255 [Blastocatellia bacterium]|nr:hypothetical protein [Blastocatellia bacterium]
MKRRLFVAASLLILLASTIALAGNCRKIPIMRSDSLLLTMLLLFVCASAASAQGRGGAESGVSALVTNAAHLKLKPAEWRSLSERQIVTRALAGGHSKEMAGFGAMIAEASPEEFIKAFSALSVFKSSETTLACGRFGAQPAIEDLAGLEISDKDLYSLMRAKAKESDIKLSEADLARIRAAAGPSPYFSSRLKAKLAAEYKQILLDKAKAYAESGETALDVYADQEEPVSARDAFSAMVKFQAASGSNPLLYSLLEQPTRDAAQNAESFLYWALQKFGQLKPVLSLVHVVIHREGDRVFIASKQIYSSHYAEAGLSVAELIPFTGEKGAKRTLAAYTIRLQVDLLGGPMGFMKKRAAQPRMLETMKTGLEALRRCAESLLAERQS